VYTAAEDRPGTNVVVLSYGLWQRRYAGNRGFIGGTITLDRVRYTVVGVMPKNFVFPLRGPDNSNRPADLWVPMAFTPTELQGWGNMFNNSVLARLKPGVTTEQAQSEADMLANQIQQAYPPSMTKQFPGVHVRVTVDPFHQEVAGSVRPMLLMLMAAVGLVLLIACANVATLLLSRAASRQREVAIRAALGASRMRLMRQMLTESFVLAIAGGTLGVLLAYWGTGMLLSLVPLSIPLPHGVALGGSVLFFVLGICCVTAIVFGIVPAFQVSSISLQGSLQEGGRSGTPGRARHRLQGFFVSAEFALALVLLVGAGLLIRSFAKLLRTDPGFRPDHVLTMNVPLPYQAYPKAAQIRQFYEQSVARVANLPGVKFAGVSNDLPLNADETDIMRIEGRPDSTPAVRVTWTLGNYFQVLGIRLLEGREFTPEDREKTQLVALLSPEAAREFWPGQDPIGKRITGAASSGWMTVVGVVGEVNDSGLGEKPKPHVYIPYLQVPDRWTEDNIGGELRSMNIAVRAASDPAKLTSAITGQIHWLDPELAIAKIRTMDQEIGSSVAGPKFNTSLLGVFAAVALFLAAIGIYGVLAYAVTQQTHEIGIRLALGAQQRDVLRLILGQGAKLALSGVGIGIVAALSLTRLMATLLFGVSATDPLTFGAVALVLFGVALLACYIPARRAMRTDPMVALRYE
jgi:putative ABC transport system permease protein